MRGRRHREMEVRVSVRSKEGGRVKGWVLQCYTLKFRHTQWTDAMHNATAILLASDRHNAMNNNKQQKINQH
ncbi:hypothetical protein A2U01_0023418, partial [Trifolium medium]|nr:hypothetical protein [Trifolium medium]